MSEPAAVVTAEGPGDTRAGKDIGRRARLELRFAYRGGRTVLVRSYAEPPFRIGKCLDDDDGLHLIIASSAPGVFGGDRFDQHVILEEGARLTLASQSSLQVHPGLDGGTAALTSRFEVAAGARLRCEWHPVIPFAGAKSEQRIAIEADETASVRWSDAIMRGREARGERWECLRLAHQLRLIVSGQLQYLERYSIEPLVERPDAAWMAADSAYLGTVLELDSMIDRASTDATHARLQALPGVRAAADLVAPRLMLIRMMASSGVSFHTARARLSREDGW
jgi:urease accessory protein